MNEPASSAALQDLGDSGSFGQANVLSKRLNKILETRLDTDKVSVCEITFFQYIIFQTIL